MNLSQVIVGVCVFCHRNVLCMKVVTRVSEGFRLYGSNRFVISQRVRLLSSVESVSEVFRTGDVGSVGDGLCSVLCSVCTILEFILAEMKSNSL